MHLTTAHIHGENTKDYISTRGIKAENIKLEIVQKFNNKLVQEVWRMML